MTSLAIIISFVLSYLLGSLNISIIIGKIKGDDIRNHGSGNAGATNSLRTYGKKIAGLVLLGDFLKAVISVLLGGFVAKLLGIDDFGYSISRYASALGAVLGHNYPIYFGFKGGKGIITSVGAIFMLDPLAGLVILVSGVLVIVFTRFVSLGSIVGALMYPVFVISTNLSLKGKTVPYYMTLSVIMAALAVYRHRANIKRLLAGNESKLGKKK